MSLLKNKKGADLVHGTIIFIILNLLFFSAMFAFVYRTGTNAALSEQAYAKELSLLIDKSKPGTIILLDVSNIEEFLNEENMYNRAFSFSNNEVNVKLTEDSEGYSFPYFSGYDVDSAFEKGKLKIAINDN